MPLVECQLIAILSKKEFDSYAKASDVVQEVLSGIRTVFAYNGVQKEHTRQVFTFTIIDLNSN